MKRALAQAASAADYQRIDPPIVEKASLWTGGLGSTSDVVSKEMFTFATRGNEEVALRPEGTASIMRAALQHSELRQGSARLWYCGPMFRYERPQRGRSRQFTQFGVEHIGDASPHADVETVAVAWAALHDMGLDPGWKPVILLNTLGDEQTRAQYSAELTQHLQAHASSLSEDSASRLARGAALRVLDSKHPDDAAVVAAAPTISQHLTPAAGEHWDAVTQALTALGMTWVHDPALVRGLDYYCHTAFEVVLVPADEPDSAAAALRAKHAGQAATVLAGGRYDGLSRLLGGKDLPGVGWAAGLERLALALAPPAGLPRAHQRVYLGMVPQDDGAARAGDIPAWFHRYAAALRAAGCVVHHALKARKPRKHISAAERAGCAWVALASLADVQAGHVQLRDPAGQTRAVSPGEVAAQVLGAGGSVVPRV